MYFMLSWIPTLFVDAGYTRAQGIEALTGFNLGAVPGILVLAFLTTRLTAGAASFFILPVSRWRISLRRVNRTHCAR